MLLKSRVDVCRGYCVTVGVVFHYKGGVDNAIQFIVHMCMYGLYVFVDARAAVLTLNGIGMSAFSSISVHSAFSTASMLSFYRLRGAKTQAFMFNFTYIPEINLYSCIPGKVYNVCCVLFSWINTKRNA